MNNKIIRDLREKYKSSDKNGKIVIVAAIFLSLLVFFLFIAFVIGMLTSAFRSFSGAASHSYLYYGLIDPGGRLLTLGVFVIFLIAILIMGTPRDMKNKAVTQDVRGVNFMEKGTFGTSKWMTPEEAAIKYTVKPIRKTKKTVYGQLTQNGEQVVAFKGSVNSLQNNLVIGAPGTGKSFSFVRTELIQSIYRGDSIICTDPSGELYTSMAYFCKQRGVDVKVLNLANPEYSDFWNCMNEIIDPETERLDGSRLNEFVAIYMKNSSDGGKEDQFWFNSTNNLLKAVIGYVAFAHEKAVITDLQLLYDKIASKDPEWSKVRSAFNNDMVSIRWCKNVIREAAAKYDYDLNEVEELFKAIELKAPKRTIGEAFRYIINFKEIADSINSMPDNHPGKLAYQIFQQNSSDSVQGSALQGTSMRLQLFTDEKMNAMLSHDGINLQSINQKQSAYFVIMSDKSTATKPIASLFFSFFFKDAQDNWDIAAGVAKERGFESPTMLPKDDPYHRVPVTVMLDEFFSIGVIGGSPDSFTVTMSNSRKRLLHISIIVQAISQVASLYGEANANVIFTDCSTVVFLGCNDLETAEFISKFAGEATVMSESHVEMTGMFAGNGTNNVNVSSSKRPLLTVDEVRRFGGTTAGNLRKVLIIKSGEHPLELTAFPYIQHPAYVKGYLQEKDIRTMVESLSSRIATLSMIENATVSDGTGIEIKRDYVKEMMINLKPKISENETFDVETFNVDPDTGEVIENVSSENKPEDIIDAEVVDVIEEPDIKPEIAAPETEEFDLTPPSFDLPEIDVTNDFDAVISGFNGFDEAPENLPDNTPEEITEAEITGPETPNKTAENASEVKDEEVPKADKNASESVKKGPVQTALEFPEISTPTAPPRPVTRRVKKPKKSKVTTISTNNKSILND